VDLRRDFRSAIGVCNGEHVPVVAITEAAGLRNRFPQVLVVEESLCLVGFLEFRIVDSINREFPGPTVWTAVDRALNRDALPDGPPVLLGGITADNDPGPMGDPGLLLFVREVVFLAVDA